MLRSPGFGPGSGHFRFSRGVQGRPFVELVFAGIAAEMESLSLVLAGAVFLREVNVHPAHRISCGRHRGHGSLLFLKDGAPLA
jgi:hypothetical protein